MQTEPRDGKVVLNNVTVSGNIIIRGGGNESSIVICRTSEAKKVIIAKNTGKIHFQIKNDTKVEAVEIEDGSKNVVLEGATANVNIKAQEATISLVSARFNNVTIEGKDLRLVIDDASSVDNIVTEASVIKARVVVMGNCSQSRYSAAYM